MPTGLCVIRLERSGSVTLIKVIADACLERGAEPVVRYVADPAAAAELVREVLADALAHCEG